MGAIAELYVQVGAKIDGLMSGMQDVDRRMRETSAGIDAAAGSAGGLRDIFLGGLGAEVVAGALSSAIGAVSDFVGSALDHLGEVEQINAQTAAAIASTGGAAGVSAEQVSALANSIEAATGVSGEMIQQGENLLLTFTNIKNRAGEGNAVFDQTVGIMADMSAALGTDAKGAALQLGKALNDPIQGVSALQRVGVSFTDGQKASIKAMQEHGNVAGAQKLILAELNKEFGGSAEAFGRTWPGILEKAGAAWENFGDALLGPLMPAFKAGMATMADTVNHLADAIGNEGLLKTIGSAFGPTTLALIAGVGAAIAVHVTPSIIAAGIAAATSLPAIAAGFAAGVVAAAPLIATFAAVAFAVRPILQNWSQIPGAFSAYMGLAESTILSWYQSAREVAIKVGDAFHAVAANIAGYFNKVFGGLGQELQAQWNNLPEAVRGPLSGIAGAFKGMAVEVGGAVATIPGMVAGHVKRVAGAAYDLAAPIGREFLNVGQIARTYLGDLGKYIDSFGADTVKAFGKIGDDAGEAHAAGHKKGGKKVVDQATKDAKAAAAAWHKELMARTAAQAIELAKAIQGVGAAIGAVQVLHGLKGALADVEARAAEGVAGFDRYAERAALLRNTMADLKAVGIGPAAPAIVALATAIGQADAASGRFQAGQKELGDTFATLSEGLAANASRAEALGWSYNQSEADIATMETALDKLLTAKVKNADAIEHLSKQLAEARGPFGQATKAAETFRKTLGEFRSPLSDLEGGLKTVGETLGVEFGSGLAGATLKAVDFAQGIGAIVSGGSGMVTFLTGPGAQALGQFSGFLTATVIPAVLGAIPAIGTGLTTAFGAMAVAVNAAIWPVTLIAAGIAGAIIAGEALYENWDAIGAAIKPLWDGIAGAAGAAFGAVAGFVTGAGQFIAAPFVAAWQAVAGVLGPIWDGIAAAGSAAFGALGNVLGEMALGLKPIWDGITGTIKGGVNILIEVINTLIRGVNNMSRISVPDWVPGIGGKSWGGFNLPQVPLLAAGGLTTGPAMAMIGEGRYQEAVLPLSKNTYQQLADGITSAGGRSGGGAAASSTTVINVHVNYTGTGKWTRQDADALGPLLVERLRAAGLGR